MAVGHETHNGKNPAKRFGAFICTEILDTDFLQDFDRAFEYLAQAVPVLFDMPRSKLIVYYDNGRMSTSNKVKWDLAYGKLKELLAVSRLFGMTLTAAGGYRTNPEVNVTFGLDTYYTNFEPGMPDRCTTVIPSSHIAEKPAMVESYLDWFLKHLHREAITGFCDFDYDAIGWRAKSTTFENVHDLKLPTKDYYRRKLRGFYWMNILTREHVKLLGGAEVVLREYPHSRSLGEESAILLLQAADNVHVMAKKDYVRLYEFLKPVLEDSVRLSWVDIDKGLYSDYVYGSSISFFEKTHLYFDFPQTFDLNQAGVLFGKVMKDEQGVLHYIAPVDCRPPIAQKPSEPSKSAPAKDGASPIEQHSVNNDTSLVIPQDFEAVRGILSIIDGFHLGSIIEIDPTLRCSIELAGYSGILEFHGDVGCMLTLRDWPKEFVDQVVKILETPMADTQ